MRILFLCGMALLALLPSVVLADEPVTRRQPDLVLTHNGHPQLVAAIDAWARATGGFIRNGGNKGAYADALGTSEPQWAYRGWTKLNVASDGKTILKCNIIVRDTQDPAAWMHEVGHCLGLPHYNLADSIMNDASNSGKITVGDVQRLRAIYVPKSWRVYPIYLAR